MHCPSTPTLIPGGEPTDCMYNGDVTLMADALQSFEGTITTSGDLTITGDTSSLDSVTFILTGSGNINIIDPGRLNDPNIRITTAGSTTPIILPTIISTIMPTGISTGTTPTFTLNADSTLTLNADSTPLTINTGAIPLTGATPITINTDAIPLILNADINIDDLIATTPLILNERQPLAVGSTIMTDTGMLTLRVGDLITRAATSSSPAIMFTLSEGQSLAVGSTLTAIDGTTFTISEGDNLNLNTLSITGTTPITLNADINIDDLIVATATTPITINARTIATTPLAVGSTIITESGMLTIRAGDIIIRAATSSSPAIMFTLIEGQSLAVGSTLTAIDGTTFTISESDNIILNTLSTTGTLSLTESNNDPTSSNNSSNTGAIVGGISGGVVLLASVAYWLWPSDKAPLAQFQAFNADAYLPARQWIGMEHALTQDIKFAVGSFWLSDGTVNTITPSMDNTGVDVRLSLAPRGFGEFSFSAAAYNYKDADSQYKEDGTTTDLFLDNFQVSNERLEFGYALGLQWRASF